MSQLFSSNKPGPAFVVCRKFNISYATIWPNRPVNRLQRQIWNLKDLDSRSLPMLQTAFVDKPVGQLLLCNLMQPLTDRHNFHAIDDAHDALLDNLICDMEYFADLYHSERLQSEILTSDVYSPSRQDGIMQGQHVTRDRFHSRIITFANTDTNADQAIFITFAFNDFSQTILIIGRTVLCVFHAVLRFGFMQPPLHMRVGAFNGFYFIINGLGVAIAPIKYFHLNFW